MSSKAQKPKAKPGRPPNKKPRKELSKRVRHDQAVGTSPPPTRDQLLAEFGHRLAPAVMELVALVHRPWERPAREQPGTHANHKGFRQNDWRWLCWECEVDSRVLDARDRKREARRVWQPAAEGAVRQFLPFLSGEGQRVAAGHVTLYVAHVAAEPLSPACRERRVEAWMSEVTKNVAAIAEDDARGTLRAYDSDRGRLPAAGEQPEATERPEAVYVPFEGEEILLSLLEGAAAHRYHPEFMFTKHKWCCCACGIQGSARTLRP